MLQRESALSLVPRADNCPKKEKKKRKVRELAFLLMISVLFLTGTERGALRDPETSAGVQILAGPPQLGTISAYQQGEHASQRKARDEAFHSGAPTQRSRVDNLETRVQKARVTAVSYQHNPECLSFPGAAARSDAGWQQRPGGFPEAAASAGRQVPAAGRYLRQSAGLLRVPAAQHPLQLVHAAAGRLFRPRNYTPRQAPRGRWPFRTCRAQVGAAARSLPGRVVGGAGRPIPAARLLKAAEGGERRRADGAGNGGASRRAGALPAPGAAARAVTSVCFAQSRTEP